MATTLVAISEVADKGGDAGSPAVAIAARELARHRLTMAGYKTRVVRRGNSVIVIFTDRNAPEGARGSLGAKPGFEVELDARDLRVIRSYFVR